MKKLNALTIFTATIALTGCSLSRPTVGNDMFDDTGVVTTETEKSNVRKLYKDGVETTEDAETIEGEDEDTETEEGTDEDSETGEEETSEDEDEEEEEETLEINSYHVDYSYEFALKASVADYTVIDESEKETYSLTYVKDGENVFLDMEMSHSFAQSKYFSGEEKVHAIFQDDVLYLETSIINGEETYSYKEAYGIRKHHVYHEFGDFFRYTYLDLLFANQNKEDSYSLLDQLLESEDVEIIDVDESTVTISFSYETLDATIVFDTQLNTIVSATFDSSKALEEKFANVNVHYHHHNNEESEEGSETSEEENLFKVEEAKEVMNVSFSYNNSTAEKLSDEEIAEYNVHAHNNYDHHNDHSYYGNEDDEDEDYQGHHDSDDWSHGENSEDDSDYDWDWGESGDYEDDDFWKGARQ